MTIDNPSNRARLSPLQAILGALLGLFLLFATGCNPPYHAVYLVRHADKTGSGDVPLNQAGEIRAEALATLLAGAQIQAIYSTNTRRTIGTATPLANALGVSIQIYRTPSEVAAAILAQPKGQAVLVVGHSDTVPTIVQALGSPLPPGLPAVIPDDDFDNLVLVLIDADGQAGTLLTTYGAPSPAP